MRQFTSRNLICRRKDADPAGYTIPAAPPPECVKINTYGQAKKGRTYFDVKVVHHRCGESWGAALVRLGHNLGSAGRDNTQRGRWFRFTRFQAEVAAGCIIYVLLCLAAVLLRTGYLTVHWLRGL